MARTLVSVARQAHQKINFGCLTCCDCLSLCSCWLTILKGKEVSVKKKLKIRRTDDCVAQAFFPYNSDENSKRTSFAGCGGEVVKRTANYTKQFAEMLWKAQLYRKATLGAVAVNRDDVKNACQGFQSSSDRVFGDGHREIDSRPNMPIWCSLITSCQTEKC